MQPRPAFDRSDLRPTHRGNPLRGAPLRCAALLACAPLSQRPGRCKLVIRAIADGIAAGRTKVTEAELAPASAEQEEAPSEESAAAPSEPEATEPAASEEPEPAESADTADSAGEPVGAENGRQS